MDQTVRKQIKKNILRQSIAEIIDDEQVNWQDVKTKVSQGDITYTIAITVAQRKIEEFEKTTGNEKGLKLLPLYKNTRIISYILMAIYLGLSLFQKPSWCLAKPVFMPDQNSYYDDCSGTTLEGSVIIVSTLPYLQNWQLILIEVFCITLLTARKLLKQYIKQRKSLYFKILVFLTVLLYVCEVLQYKFGITFPFNQFIRPIYLMTYAKLIRKNIALYMKIIWKSKEIFVIIAGTFLIYVALGRVFFYQTPQNAPSAGDFDTFPDTMYNLFVSLSTSNYPDNMMPIFEVHRLASIYWLVFLSFVNMALLRIIIAYFYLYYKEELMTQAKKFETSLSTVFNEPEHNDLDESFNQSQIIGKLRLDHMVDQMELLHEEDTAIIFGNSRWKRKLLITLNMFAVKTVFALGSLASFLGAVSQSNEVSPDFGVPITPAQAAYNQTFNLAWLIGEFVLNYLLFMDPFLRIICLGWRYIFRSKFLVFEFVLSITILCLLALSLFGDSNLSLTPVKILMIFRFCRFVKWINCFEKYHLIFLTLYKLVPLFVNLLGVLGIVFYFYVTAGEVMFGGYVKTNSFINFNQYGDPEYYVYENYNDFYMGLCACYHLIIVNNWLYTVDVHCKVMGSYLYRLFFVSFYIVAVMMCFNILMAFILDIFVTQISNKNARKPYKAESARESPKTILRRFTGSNKKSLGSFVLSQKSFGPERINLHNDALNAAPNLNERLLEDD